MKMNQSCFLKVEKKNAKSFVRQIWLGPRRNEILFDMKHFIGGAVGKGGFGTIDGFGA